MAVAWVTATQRTTAQAGALFKASNCHPCSGAGLLLANKAQTESATYQARTNLFCSPASPPATAYSKLHTSTAATGAAGAGAHGYPLPLTSTLGPSFLHAVPAEPQPSMAIWGTLRVPVHPADPAKPLQPSIPRPMHRSSAGSYAGQMGLLAQVTGAADVDAARDAGAASHGQIVTRMGLQAPCYPQAALAQAAAASSAECQAASQAPQAQHPSSWTAWQGAPGVSYRTSETAAAAVGGSVSQQHYPTVYDFRKCSAGTLWSQNQPQQQQQQQEECLQPPILAVGPQCHRPVKVYDFRPEAQAQANVAAAAPSCFGGVVGLHTTTSATSSTIEIAADLCAPGGGFRMPAYMRSATGIGPSTTQSGPPAATAVAATTAPSATAGAGSGSLGLQALQQQQQQDAGHNKDVAQTFLSPEAIGALQALVASCTNGKGPAAAPGAAAHYGRPDQPGIGLVAAASRTVVACTR